MTTCTCGKPVERKSKFGSAPKFCPDCLRERKLAQKRTYNTHKRNQSPPTACVECGEPLVQRTGPGRPRRLCDDCRNKRCATQPGRWPSDRNAEAPTRKTSAETRIARRTAQRLLVGLTDEAFDALLASQGGCCGDCGADNPRAKNRDWAIDHDHSCCGPKRACEKCVRGLLCHPCNTYIDEAFEEKYPERLQKLMLKVERLEATMRYLERHRRKIQAAA